MNFTEMKAHELAELIRSKKVSSKEVTAAFIERIKKLNPKLNAFVSEEFESALKTAEDNDKKLSAGVSICSPLFGVPVALKDNMCSEGTKVTCCSKILNNFISQLLLRN